MCFLKIHSKNHTFKKFCETTKVPVYSVFDKDEYRNKSKTRKSDSFVVSFDVSDAEWDDFPSQVNDAIKFLTANFSELDKLIGEIPDADGYLDFPLYSRLNEEVVNQNDHLPKELIRLAGKLGLGIEMAIYSQEAFE
ncbi:hypothetical protein [Shewanella sp. 10N.286.54.B9]|uniref:hypothetical protein n=1 Tax=Shewanella sp. 10N.286.54.B9 TaxID=3229719 RepID=UPI00354C9313